MCQTVTDIVSLAKAAALVLPLKETLIPSDSSMSENMVIKSQFNFA